MTGDLVAPSRHGEFLRTVKEQLAPGISDLDLEYFGLATQRLDLSPFTQPPQILPIGRWDKRAERIVHRPQVMIDGRLTLAMRSGRVVAIGAGEWCGPSDTKNGKPPVWVDFWDDDQPPHGARSTIWLAGTDIPSRAVVRWKEFAQTNKEGDLVGLWPTMPAHMLHKTALALNLRRAVPDVLPKDLMLYTEGDAESTPPVTVEEHRQLTAQPGDQWRICSCGERFPTDAAFAAHKKIPGPVPPAPPAVSATAVEAGASRPGPLPAPTGPGPKTKKRVSDDRVPDWVHDQAPESRGYK